MRLTADGRVVLKAAEAQQTAQITSTSDDVVIQERLIAGTDIFIVAGQDIENSGTLVAGNDLDLTAGNTLNNTRTGNIRSVNTLHVMNTRQLDNHGNISSVNALNVTNTRQLDNHGNISADGDITLTVDTVYNHPGSELIGQQAISITGNTLHNASTLLADGTVNINVTSDITNSADGDIISSVNALNVTNTRQLNNHGNISANGDITLTVDTVHNHPGSELIGQQAISITGNTLHNASTLLAGGTVNINVTSDITNSADGDIQSVTGPVMVKADTLDNDGVLAAATGLTVRHRELNNNGGILFSGEDLLLEGSTSNTRSEAITNQAGGTIMTLDGDITLRTQSLSNINPVTIEQQSTETRHRFVQSAPPLVPFYSRYISSAGYSQLYDGGRTRSYVFVPHPDEIERILADEGRTTWGENDWQTYWRASAGSPDDNQYDPKQWNLVVPDEAQHAPPGSAMVGLDTRDVVTSNNPARIFTGGTGNIIIDAATINNDHSVISSANDLRLDGTILNNTGSSLRRTYSLGTSYTNNNVIRTQGWFPWLEFTSTIGVVFREILGEVPAIIAAGGTLRGTLSGSVANLSNPATNQDLAGFAKTLASTIPMRPASDTRTLTPTGRVPLNLFRPAPDTSNLVYETRFAFIDVGRFFGSDYFISRLTNYPGEGTLKRLGDAYFETQLVQQQILHQTRQRYLYADTTDDIAQMKRLLDAGIAAAQSLELSPGISLSPEQQAALVSDIVWYETIEVNGQSVLTPRLYLASPGRTVRASDSAILSGRDVELTAQNLTNSGTIQATGQLQLTTTEDLSNQGGVIQSGGDMTLAAGRNLTNQSQIKRIEHDAQNILEYEAAGALIDSGGNANLKAGNLLINLGGDIAVTGDAELNAGNILISAQSRESAFYANYAKDLIEDRRTVHDASTVNIGGNLQLNAEQDLNILGSTIQSGGDIQLQAGNNINLLDVQDQHYQYTEHRSSSFFTKKNTIKEIDTRRSLGTTLTAGGDVLINVSKQAGDIIGDGILDTGTLLFNQEADSVVLVGSDITADGDILITAGDTLLIQPGTDLDYRRSETHKKGPFGTGSSRTQTSRQERQQQASVSSSNELTLKAGNRIALIAPRLDAGGDIDIESERGQIYLGTAKDSDYEHEEYSKTGWFKWEAGNKGHYDETVRHTEITAGGVIRIDAGNGVIVEYRPDGALDDSIASLSQLPELAWMGALRARDDIDWRAIEEAHQQWQAHQEGIGGPGVTLVVMAIGIASGGFGFAELAANLGITSTAGVLAFEAGMTVLVQQASVSLIANGGDIGAVFKDIFSSDTLRSIATASLTAGLTNGLHESLNLNPAAGQQLSDLTIGQRLQRGIVSSGANSAVTTALQGGNFGENFLDSFKSVTTQNLATELTGLIGDLGRNSDGTISEGGLVKVLSHATVGCAAQSLAGGNCSAGALGAATAELLAPHLTAGELGQVQSELTVLISTGLAALVTEEDLESAITAGIRVERFNRQLHLKEAIALKGEKDRIEASDLSAAEKEVRIDKLEAVSCHFVRCSEGVSEEDAGYKVLAERQAWGAQLARNNDLAYQAIARHYHNGLFVYTDTDRINDFLTRHEEGVARTLGAGQSLTATIGTIAGVAFTVASAPTCPTSGVGCALTVGSVIFTGLEAARFIEGLSDIFGDYELSSGQKVLTSFDDPENHPGDVNPLGDVLKAAGISVVEVGVGKLLVKTSSGVRAVIDRFGGKKRRGDDVVKGVRINNYGPLNKGPLPNDIARTFRSGTYSEVVTTEPTKLYRVIGDNGNPTGGYWTRAKPKAPLASVVDSAH